MPLLVEAKTAGEWVTQGIELGQEGKYAEAIKAFDEASELGLKTPGFEIIFAIVGHCFSIVVFHIGITTSVN